MRHLNHIYFVHRIPYIDKGYSYTQNISKNQLVFEYYTFFVKNQLFLWRLCNSIRCWLWCGVYFFVILLLWWQLVTVFLSIWL